ncbi:hypothetical protein [Brevibacterium aurantiacum]|uniref:hypothetical protein n=1 Tax=Brevibacterium aurantiacum TaxID=273384 RepID=UPI0018690C87|nr:hypothetical protein [Brevibacterium aurantiacum]
MSETTEELSTQSGENSEGYAETSTPEQEHALNSESVPDEQDNLLELPPEKLAGMVRDKRKAEASVRSKLREAEAERDKLAGAVTGFRRQSFAAAAKSTQLQDTALDDALKVVPLEDMLGEDGTVDAAKVKESMQALRRSHPHYFEPIPKASSIGQGGAPAGFEGASWSDVLR